MISTIVMAAAATLARSNASLPNAVRAYDAAQVRGDRQALSQLLTDDYLLVNSSGSIETKAEFIADLTSPDYHLNPYRVVRPIERTWIGGAIRGGVARLTGTSGGKPFDICLRFVDIWRNEEGRWRVAYTQAARAPDGQCSGRIAADVHH